MGGKNAIVVLADADLELAVAESALSICASTGQRCSCASRLFVERGVLDEFSERLIRVLRGVRSGPPLEDGVFMGPLVSRAAHAKLLRYRALAREAGGERLLDVDPGRPAPFAGAGLVRFASDEAGARLPARRDLRPGGGALRRRATSTKRSRR